MRGVGVLDEHAAQGVTSAVKRPSASTGLITGRSLSWPDAHVVGAEGRRDVHDAGALVVVT